MSMTTAGNVAGDLALWGSAIGTLILCDTWIGVDEWWSALIATAAAVNAGLISYVVVGTTVDVWIGWGRYGRRRWER